MFQDVKFDLITNVNKAGIKQGGQLAIEFKIDNIAPPSSSIPTLKELKTFNTLGVRLTEQLPKEDWNVTISFLISENIRSVQARIRIDNGYYFDEENYVTAVKVDALHISAAGEILEKLHSILTHDNSYARLQLQLTAKLLVTDLTARESTGNVRDTTVEFCTKLFPSTSSSTCDHRNYVSNFCAANSNTSTTIRGGNLEWKIENLHLSVEGITYDIKKLEKSVQNHSKGVMGWFIKSGRSHNLRIKTKADAIDNESEESFVYFPENILFHESSVISTMFEENKFIEGNTRELDMTNWSKKEVEAFLAFLCYGDLNKARNSSALALTLYEMGHYYNVPLLEQAMKIVLLSTHADLYGANGAIRLFNSVQGSENIPLKQMSIDILKMCTEEEITEAPAFKEMYNSGTASVTKNMFLMSLKF